MRQQGMQFDFIFRFFFKIRQTFIIVSLNLFMCFFLFLHRKILFQKAVLETIKNALKGVGGADEGPSGSIMDLRYGRWRIR